MNNSQYFNQYKAACEIIFTSHNSDRIYLKDTEFKYQAMTDAMVKFIGVESIDDILNQSIADISINLKKDIPDLIDKFKKQDLQIMKSQKRGVYLEVLPHNDSDILEIVILYKTPIINPETNEVVGIHGLMNTILWPSIIKTLFKMHGAKGLLLNSKKISDPLKDYPLTNVQHMVLFLSIHNYSYSEIALLMSEFGNPITPVQVNERLENLKLIFHVRTKTQLIEKAMGLNFHVILPCDLFNNFESIEISAESAIIVCANCRLGNCDKHTTEIIGANDKA